MIKLSVILPVYNTREYVEECIQSILSQSYKDIELMLINDGSTDGSDAICRHYEHLRNVLYIEQENRGATAARKRGVEVAHGEWIMFVDSDDLLVPDAISGIMSQCESCEIVLGGEQNYKYLFSLPDRLGRQSYLEMQYARELSSGPWAKLFRIQLFDDHALSFPYFLDRGEDYLMNLVLAVNNQTDVLVYKHQIYEKRDRLTSICHTNPLTLDYMLEFCLRGDSIVQESIPTSVFVRQRVKQRLFFFKRVLREIGYVNNPNHPFIKNIKDCLNEAKVWRPLDRLMLSVSSPWAVMAVWNMKKVMFRFQHPSMIAHDLKRIGTFRGGQ